MKTVEDRLWSRMEPDGDCWIWTGARSKAGYGQIGHRNKVVYTHRLAYELMVAEIPVGLQLDHLCRRRACMNPYHLEPVTQRENVRRGTSGEVSRQLRAQVTHCKWGHEYTPENTHVYKGARSCRTCRSLRYYERRDAKRNIEDGESA